MQRGLRGTVSCCVCKLYRCRSAALQELMLRCGTNFRTHIILKKQFPKDKQGRAMKEITKKWRPSLRESPLNFMLSDAFRRGI
jgi:hypothetical protein